MKQTIATVVGYTLAFAFIGALIWGSYWVTKKLSYEWWYESQVQQTVRDMVKEEYLK